MSENKIEIHTEGGPVITGGTFTGVEFVTHKHVYSRESEGPPFNNNERRVKSAIEQLLAATDTNGGRIFTEKAQWYAIYKVLSQLEDYPSQRKAFCMVMAEMGMETVDPPISYESLKKVQLPSMLETSKVTLWKSYLQSAEGAPRRQIMVALKFMSLLEAQ